MTIFKQHKSGDLRQRWADMKDVEKYGSFINPDCGDFFYEPQLELTDSFFFAFMDDYMKFVVSKNMRAGWGVQLIDVYILIRYHADGQQHYMVLNEECKVVEKLYVSRCEPVNSQTPVRKITYCSKWYK